MFVRPLLCELVFDWLEYLILFFWWMFGWLRFVLRGFPRSQGIVVVWWQFLVALGFFIFGAGCFWWIFLKMGRFCVVLFLGNLLGCFWLFFIRIFHSRLRTFWCSRVFDRLDVLRFPVLFVHGLLYSILLWCWWLRVSFYGCMGCFDFRERRWCCLCWNCLERQLMRSFASYEIFIVKYLQVFNIGDWSGAWCFTRFVLALCGLF